MFRNAKPSFIITVQSDSDNDDDRIIRIYDERSSFCFLNDDDDHGNHYWKVNDGVMTI